MNWFILSLVSVFALAVAELTQQHILTDKNAVSPRSSLVFTFLIQVFFALPFIFLYGLYDQLISVFKTAIIWQMIGISLLGSVSMVLYLNSFRVKNISISQIFISFSAVVSTTLGIIFFGESTSLVKFLGIFLVLLAIISLNIKNLNLEKNHYYGLLAGTIIGVLFTLDKYIVLQIHPLIYIFWASGFLSIFGFILKPKDIIKTINTSHVQVYKVLTFSAVGYFLYNLATFTAYTIGGEVGRVDAINNSQVFLVILFEYFILKRTGGTFRKIITAIVALAGVYILGQTG